MRSLREQLQGAAGDAKDLAGALEGVSQGVSKVTAQASGDNYTGSGNNYTGGGGVYTGKPAFGLDQGSGAGGGGGIGSEGNVVAGTTHAHDPFSNVPRAPSGVAGYPTSGTRSGGYRTPGKLAYIGGKWGVWGQNGEFIEGILETDTRGNPLRLWSFPDGKTLLWEKGAASTRSAGQGAGGDAGVASAPVGGSRTGLNGASPASTSGQGATITGLGENVVAATDQQTQTLGAKLDALPAAFAAALAARIPDLGLSIRSGALA